MTGNTPSVFRRCGTRVLARRTGERSCRPILARPPVCGCSNGSPRPCTPRVCFDSGRGERRSAVLEHRPRDHLGVWRRGLLEAIQTPVLGSQSGCGLPGDGRRIWTRRRYAIRRSGQRTSQTGCPPSPYQWRLSDPRVNASSKQPLQDVRLGDLPPRAHLADRLRRLKLIV
jgi:hypothetical protein